MRLKWSGAPKNGKEPVPVMFYLVLHTYRIWLGYDEKKAPFRKPS